MQIEETPAAYLLAYTLHTEDDKRTDHYEVFNENDSEGRPPVAQAALRVQELYREKFDELYSWNIASIEFTSEHYTTSASAAALEIAN